MTVEQLIVELLRQPMDANVSIYSQADEPAVSVVGVEANGDYDPSTRREVAIVLSHPVSTTIPQAAET